MFNSNVYLIYDSQIMNFVKKCFSFIAAEKVNMHRSKNYLQGSRYVYSETLKDFRAAKK